MKLIQDNEVERPELLNTGSGYKAQGEGNVRGSPPSDQAQTQGGRMGLLVSLRCPVGLM